MIFARFALAAFLFALGSGAAHAQMATLFPGLGGDPDVPIEVEAASLEVTETEAERIVTFTGGVVVSRGATTIRAATIVLFSDLQRPEAAADAAAAPAVVAAPAAGAVAGAAPALPSQQFAAADAAPAEEVIPPNQTFRRIEATGGVSVNSGDQSATGASASFNMLTQMITLSGNVRLAQGGNVITGERLVVDLANSTARVEQGGGERIRGMFMPGAGPPGTAMPGVPAP